MCTRWSPLIPSQFYGLYDPEFCASCDEVLLLNIIYTSECYNILYSNTPLSPQLHVSIHLVHMTL